MSSVGGSGLRDDPPLLLGDFASWRCPQISNEQQRLAVVLGLASPLQLLFDA
jgi:hypothetical protein